MNFDPAPIFISYSRSDGRDFAEALERRLTAEGIHAWRDLKSMGAGDIRPQVLRAIEDAKQLVLILSRRALVSDWIKREWSHARLMGKRVSPVLADPTLTRADLPAWMKREEVFDIDPARDRDEERWKALVLVLRGDGRAKRTPYMPGDISANFEPRPAEYQGLKNAVLAEVPKRTVGLTTALRGAGGYGKTTLANALCRDDDVRFEFSDGILRVEIGKDRADVTGLVTDLIEKLDPNGKRPGFADVLTASEHLGELLGESRVLLVIDDVWREAQLKPFLRGGPNCVRLVTTRMPAVLPLNHVPVQIDEMRAAEAARLIAVNLPGAGQPATAARLAALAVRLGKWAQMLAIANGWLRDRVAKEETVADAIEKFEMRLAKNGPFIFDPKDETDRNKAIRLCIAASVDDLDTAEAARFSELAVIPEDEEVPLSVVEALWAGTGKFDEDETEDLLCRLDALSLLQRLNLKQGARTLRLHDNLLWYLRDKLGTDGLRAAHAAILRALGACCGSRWDELPPENRYGWRFLIRHLRSAGEDAAADHLLTDYPWIKAKLNATDARSLYSSYLPESSNADVSRIGRAIALSLPPLAADKRELALQLYGRLGDTRLACAAAARLDLDCRPKPRWPGLTPPGAELFCLRGHERTVWSAAFSPFGDRIVTSSEDETARIWDATTGAEIATLRGHGGAVQSAAFSPDGARIVTASADRTARIWDAATGLEFACLRGLERRVRSAAFSPDGARIVTGSSDGTARIWDSATGTQILVLRGHENRVNGATFSPDGASIVTASFDGTARIWQIDRGGDGVPMQGHEEEVLSAAFSPDGRRIVTSSEDGTVRIWDAVTGAEIFHLSLHEHQVRSAVFSPDGARIVTASVDGTTRIWDTSTRAEIVILRGHEAAVQSAAFSPDGARVVTGSEDVTARIWSTMAGADRVPLRGHECGVQSAAFSPDGAYIVTSCGDSNPRIWDANTGEESFCLGGHKSGVHNAAFSSDGGRIVTASKDGTARIWNAETGAEILSLNGREGAVNSAEFSPDGARIVTTSGKLTARVWDSARGAEIVRTSAHDAEVQSAAFSPDGARIVTASDDGTARIWNAATGSEIFSLHGGNGALRNAAYSPDGARIVTVSFDRVVRLWNANTGADITLLRGYDGGVWSIAFSADGTRIVTASGDGTARIWDAATGAEIISLLGHQSWMRRAAFSPNGNRVITASSDRTARIWDSSTGVELAHVTLDAAVQSLAVHGTAFALGDSLGRLHVFDAEDFLG